MGNSAPTQETLYLARKNLISYSEIATNAITLIKGVVTQDEGGWVLTGEFDNSDGGWTYGGMTKLLFNTYFVAPTAAVMKELIADQAKMLRIKQDCMRIYAEEFFYTITVMKSADIQQMHISCAINLGFRGFMTVWNDTSRSAGKGFQTYWKNYYISDCQRNPHKLPDLAGWINRIWRYLPGI